MPFINIYLSLYKNVLFFQKYRNITMIPANPRTIGVFWDSRSCDIIIY